MPTTFQPAYFKSCGDTFCVWSTSSTIKSIDWYQTDCSKLKPLAPSVVILLWKNRYKENFHQYEFSPNKLFLVMRGSIAVNRKRNNFYLNSSQFSLQRSLVHESQTWISGLVPSSSSTVGSQNSSARQQEPTRLPINTHLEHYSPSQRVTHCINTPPDTTLVTLRASAGFSSRRPWRPCWLPAGGSRDLMASSSEACWETWTSNSDS